MERSGGATPGGEDVRYFSGDSDLIDRSGLSDEDVEQCIRVMTALHDWQEASRALSEASQRYMRLNQSDMRAIRMIMRAQKQGILVTPKDIAREVGISSASTTKLIDRLVAADHLARVAHPTDRRTTCLEVTESTRRSAHDTIGRQHARRFAAAASVSAADRSAVLRFLAALIEADALQDDLRDAGSHEA
ncbi:MAG: MarR family winged helix-turn-helix transcriptional regulator [Microbacterium sp.]